MRIKQQRQLLVLHLAQLLDSSFSGADNYRTDRVLNDLAGGQAPRVGQ